MDEDSRDTLAQASITWPRRWRRSGSATSPASSRRRGWAASSPRTTRRPTPRPWRMLREAGEGGLLEAVGALRAERLAAGQEEAWRAAESGAPVMGPDGLLPLAQAEASQAREADPVRRRALAAAVARALEPAAGTREQASELRVRVRAEHGLVPDWRAGGRSATGCSTPPRTPGVELLAYAARRDLGLAPQPRGDLTSADLLQAARLPGLRRALPQERGWPSCCGPPAARSGSTPGPCASPRPRGWRRGQAPHALGERVSFRPRGGLPDWPDLLDAAGRSAIAARQPPPRRDATFAAAFGWLLRRCCSSPASSRRGSTSRSGSRSRYCGRWRSGRSSGCGPRRGGAGGDRGGAGHVRRALARGPPRGAHLGVPRRLGRGPGVTRRRGRAAAGAGGRLRGRGAAAGRAARAVRRGLVAQPADAGAPGRPAGGRAASPRRRSPRRRRRREGWSALLESGGGAGRPRLARGATACAAAPG